MDTQILSALITGFFGALVTPLITKIIIPAFQKRGKNSQAESKTVSSAAVYLQAGVGGIIGVLLGYFLIGQILVSPCPPFSPTSVTITSPVNGTSSPRLITVEGTACHLADDDELWIMVVPEGVTSYYPQMGPIVISENGNWSASAYLGLDNPVDAGRGFVIIVAIANQQGATAIRSYFSQSGPDFKGLEPLPQGIKLMAQVRVIRK